MNAVGVFFSVQNLNTYNGAASCSVMLSAVPPKKTRVLLGDGYASFFHLAHSLNTPV
jgi:hypothetical protein